MWGGTGRGGLFADVKGREDGRIEMVDGGCCGG